MSPIGAGPSGENRAAAGARNSDGRPATALYAPCARDGTQMQRVFSYSQSRRMPSAAVPRQKTSGPSTGAPQYCVPYL